MDSARALLLLAAVSAALVASALAVAARAGGGSGALAVVAGIGAFVSVCAPLVAIFLWTRRRAADLEELTDRTRRLAGGEVESVVADREYRGELDRLARVIDELRATLMRRHAAVEEHRAAMDEIVSSLGEGLLAVSRQGRVVVANRRIAEMFGSRFDLVGRSVLEVVRKQSVAAAFEKALAGKTSTDRVTYESGGAERQIEIRAFPVEASADIAAVALFIDVTTIERLQRIRADFLDDFSHEVRTPLAGLRSAAETLEHGGLTPEHEDQLRHVMQRQIARIERLVHDLSELNRIESGELILKKHPVNLRALLNELADDFQERIADVRVAVRGGDLIAPVDAPRAQQIFTNLLDNACKHGGVRGEVDVVLAREERDAVVRISDRGPGIPPQELDRIFHRFYRIDRSRSQPGTGLGLAIAKHLAVLHGGTINAYNRPEGGATFEVRLPAEAR